MARGPTYFFHQLRDGAHQLFLCYCLLMTCTWKVSMNADDESNKSSWRPLSIRSEGERRKRARTRVINAREIKFFELSDARQMTDPTESVINWSRKRVNEREGGALVSSCLIRRNLTQNLSASPLHFNWRGNSRVDSPNESVTCQLHQRNFFGGKWHFDLRPCTIKITTKRAFWTKI
jgi:hypothetical protein